VASSGERLLGAEWVVVMLVQTGDAFGESTDEQFSLPQPSRYWASLVAYLMLAAFALFGDKASKLAGGLGAVAALAILLAPPDPTAPIAQGNYPLIIRFLGWLSSMYSQGPAGPGQSTATTSPGLGPGGSSPAPGSTLPSPSNPLTAPGIRGPVFE
jgi:hypothetical protein